VTDRLVAEFPSLSRRQQVAARFILDRPQDVALLSMREQARRAGVPPATMTRLAQRLGLNGYDDVRRSYADAVRRGVIGYGARAADLASRLRKGGSEALIAQAADALARHILMLAEPETAAHIAAAADELARSNRIYCLGLRSSFPVAFTFYYICSLAGRPVTLLDGAGGTGLDVLADATAGEALFVTSVRPYTKATVQAAKLAATRGLALVAITDSRVSPLTTLARHAIVVETGSPSFFDAKTAALAATEMLAMLITAHGGAQALAAVEARERYLAAVDAYWPTQTGRTSP
jgi:DNA-binding MurR/RpiR family transcriptional regulator